LLKVPLGFISEKPSLSHIYHGGEKGGTKVISIEVNAFEGGLDEKAKEKLNTRFTAAVRTRVGLIKMYRFISLCETYLQPIGLYLKI
jgi:hypothetical protein